MALTDQSDKKIAASFALGLLVAFSPFWGLQTFIAISIALFFNLNKILVLLAVNVSSIPPFIPFIIIAGYQCGSMMLTGAFAEEVPKLSEMSSIGEHFMAFVLGSLTVGLGLAATTYVLVLSFLRFK